MASETWHASDAAGPGRSLRQLFNRDLAGLVLLEGWWLERRHSTMGAQPALVASPMMGGQAEVVCCADRAVLDEIISRLPHEGHDERPITLLVNTHDEWAYNVQNEHRGETRPMRFLDRPALDRLLATNLEPFKWG